LIKTARLDQPLAVALVGLALSVAIAGNFLARYGVTWFLQLPTDDSRYIEYAEERIGPVSLNTASGHDGKYFFVLANDPWLISPQENAQLLDAPAFRAQRILYPMIASGFGLFPPLVIVWSLLFVNVIAMAVGVWATARVAIDIGASGWFGLLFALNPGVVLELAIDGGSIVGMTFAFWGLAEVFDQRLSRASVLFSAAVLARETMWLIAIGAAIYIWRGSRAHAGILTVPPTVVAGLWALWVRIRLSGRNPMFLESFSLPFSGLANAVGGWLELGGLHLLIGALVVMSAVIVVVKTFTERSLVAFATVGFAALIPILDLVVLERFFDVSRALAPLVLSAVLLLASATAESPPAKLD
jgi:hypothetical protein